MAWENAEDHEKGDFNSGLAIIYRLDTVHKEIHLARVKLDFNAYYQWLIGLYIELSRVMKPEEIKTQLELWDKTKQDYFNLRKMIREKNIIDASLLESFYYWEIELTKIEQDKGMGMPKKKDSRYALSRG